MWQLLPLCSSGEVGTPVRIRIFWKKNQTSYESTDFSRCVVHRDSLKEFDRVLIDGGLIVIKCQDKVSGGTQYISHNAIINYCEHLGFYCEDIFILLAKNRLCANWQIKSQKSSRKFHSYFLVMRKNCKKVNKIKSVFYE